MWVGGSIDGRRCRAYADWVLLRVGDWRPPGRGAGAAPQHRLVFRGYCRARLRAAWSGDARQRAYSWRGLDAALVGRVGGRLRARWERRPAGRKLRSAWRRLRRRPRPAVMAPPAISPAGPAGVAAGGRCLGGRRPFAALVMRELGDLGRQVGGGVFGAHLRGLLLIRAFFRKPASTRRAIAISYPPAPLLAWLPELRSGFR